MDGDLQEVKKKLEDVEGRFEATMGRLIDVLSKHNGGNQSTITLNAGGFGVWLATTCCFVMLAVNVVLVGTIISHDRKIDDLSHYLNAIYMIAPSLKPKE